MVGVRVRVPNKNKPPERFTKHINLFKKRIKINQPLLKAQNTKISRSNRINSINCLGGKILTATTSLSPLLVTRPQFTVINFTN